MTALGTEENVISCRSLGFESAIVAAFRKLFSYHACTWVTLRQVAFVHNLLPLFAYVFTYVFTYGFAYGFAYGYLYHKYIELEELLHFRFLLATYF